MNPIMIPKIVSRFFISANISGNNSNIAIYNNIPSVIEVIIAKNIELMLVIKVISYVL